MGQSRTNPMTPYSTASAVDEFAWVPTIMFLSTANVQRRPRPDVDATNRRYSSTQGATLVVATFSVKPGNEITHEYLLVTLQHTLHYAR